MYNQQYLDSLSSGAYGNHQPQQQQQSWYVASYPRAPINTGGMPLHSTTSLNPYPQPSHALAMPVLKHQDDSYVESITSASTLNNNNTNFASSLTHSSLLNGSFSRFSLQPANHIPLSTNSATDMSQGLNGSLYASEGFGETHLQNLYSVSMPQKHSVLPIVDSKPALKTNDVSMKESDASLGSPPVPMESPTSNEKRRKRRESHNAIERRRRDYQNELLAELAELLPGEQQGKPQKSIVLSQSLAYMKAMKTCLREHESRTVELENLVKLLSSRLFINEEDLGLTKPLGSIIPLDDLYHAELKSQPGLKQ